MSVQTVKHISGKTADLLRDDKVDLSRLAFLDHFEKVLTVQNGSAGNALIYLKAVFDTILFLQKNGFKFLGRVQIL